MHSKKSKIVIILILAINILLLIYLIKYKPTSSLNTNQIEVGQLINENLDEKTSIVFNNKLFPANYIEFENKYNGVVNVDDIYLRLNTLTKYINDISNMEELKLEETMNKYYESNREYIKTATTINNINDFKNFTNKILKISNNGSVRYQNVYFILDDIDNNKYEINIKYSNNEVLEFNLNLDEKNKNFKFIF